eukprot:TRINITY_DN6473_c1_g1_i1.p1 TRINITY_DN6473_c1_g1~~TRINITY_DN6473_c1_g1_i1.p1  ORF type:complete len:203 (+),score=42.56 TRINITY_DN6473_c1_g1_i1:90-698(+)
MVHPSQRLEDEREFGGDEEGYGHYYAKEREGSKLPQRGSTMSAATGSTGSLFTVGLEKRPSLSSAKDPLQGCSLWSNDTLGGAAITSSMSLRRDSQASMPCTEDPGLQTHFCREEEFVVNTMRRERHFELHQALSKRAAQLRVRQWQLNDMKKLKQTSSTGGEDYKTVKQLKEECNTWRGEADRLQKHVDGMKSLLSLLEGD